ncbi:MAG TPA: hypothetical protein VKB88_19450 [Bryobacteraceae bacterium]|nr:hypothetical protein [Bryobacteraceae bacterium]
MQLGALHFVDEFAMAGHGFAILESRLEHPQDLFAGVVREHAGPLDCAGGIGLLPPRRAIENPLLRRDGSVHIVGADLDEAAVPASGESPRNWR